MSRPDQWVWPEPTAARYPTLKAAIHLGADEVLRLALQAYYAAVRDMQPPDGQRWLWSDATLEALPWASPRDLHDGLLHHLGERLWAHAAATGHLAASAVDDDDRPAPPGGGRSPPDKGQGWPALAPAVGPAPTPCPEAGDSVVAQSLDITLHANPLLLGQHGKELPGETSRDTFDQSGEKLP